MAKRPKPTGKRWAWDMNPFQKDAAGQHCSWGAFEVGPEDKYQRADHRVYVYRTQYDGGSVGPVRLLGDDYSERDMKLEMAGKAKGLHCEVYFPATEDFALLERCYPKADPHRPAWYKIKRDLVAAGHDPDKLDNADVPTMLGWLRMPKAGNIKVDAQAAKWPAVRDDLLAMKAHGKTYTTERCLANALRCSPGTVHKVIQKTPELQKWRRGKGKITIRTKSLSEAVTNRRPGKADDPADAAAANEKQDRLIQEQARDMRAEGGRNRVCGRRA
jgi:hypothetical protein